MKRCCIEEPFLTNMGVAIVCDLQILAGMWGRVKELEVLLYRDGDNYM